MVSTVFFSEHVIYKSVSHLCILNPKIFPSLDTKLKDTHKEKPSVKRNENGEKNFNNNFFV